MFRMFPLLLLPIIVYNLIALGGGTLMHHDIQEMLSYDHSIAIKLMSRAEWKFSFGDSLDLAGLALLFVEIVKATRTTAREIVSHALSMLVFILALIEFITLKGFASTPFFFMTVMTLFDVVGGYTISIVAAEHDLGLGRAGTD